MGRSPVGDESYCGTLDWGRFPMGQKAAARRFDVARLNQTAVAAVAFSQNVRLDRGRVTQPINPSRRLRLSPYHRAQAMPALHT